MKCRKKQIVVDAVQLKDNFIWPDWLEAADEKGDIRIIGTGGCWYMQIKTLEGEMRAQKGDYVVQGIKGEIYPCKPDIFGASYEVLEEGEE